MTDRDLICPYTGLRSFTEDESLYFKGRDEHIDQATHQLQRNKFLMLTGASGDGKSSLVYAGIVPNARAGFLKSKYSQWLVADFRPERAPFHNLCRAISSKLGIANMSTVESELQHGFSALVDLYKSSSFYVEPDADSSVDDKTKASQKRNAANLIIIVDQFEEFFTNPENYHNGVPSKDSNLALNVLLETARISFEEDLPIYVVFTMRSDFIGQCAAFRSLPEYIGFSQFFVPRLNRSQLQQVIEEPATLSGIRISRRLTERLIHDISEGVDQLPILQHALKQIWHAADEGRVELDLIHYAMVGGMPAAELPDDQVEVFLAWYAQLPARIKMFYAEPNLQNVLDSHANKLYESAGASYRRESGNNLGDDDARMIVKTAFVCLTKIDQSRAVRNRMTLKEIYDILNRPDIDVKTVADVLKIFREPTNTFIRPFISDDPESEQLSEDAVLDITHESLIRNWELLESWAQEEFSKRVVAQDFEQQLNRWLANDRSRNFLLSMGPLTYFENWMQKAKPNAWWIARYLPEEGSDEEKFARAASILSNANEFLRRSARRHAVTRSVLKYGPRRIVAAVAVLVLLVFSSFGVNNYINRQNSAVLKQIKRESLLLASNKKVPLEERGPLLVENLRAGNLTLREIVNGIPDTVERLNAIGAMVTSMVAMGRHGPQPEMDAGIKTLDSLFEHIPNSLHSSAYAEVLREENDFVTTLTLASYFNPDRNYGEVARRNSRRIADRLMTIATVKPSRYTDIRNFETAIDHCVNNLSFSSSELREFIRLISPLEDRKITEWERINFQRDKISERGRFNYGFAFNGLYQELAYLYAAEGNLSRVKMCIDTLLKYNQRYYTNNYTTMPENADEVAAVLFKYGKLKEIDDFIAFITTRTKRDAVTFYEKFVARNRFDFWAMLRLNFREWNNVYLNLGLFFSSPAQQDYFISKLRYALANIGNPDERNFKSALWYKNIAVINVFSLENQAKKHDEAKIKTWLDSAVFHYRRVSQKYLDEKVSMFNNSESNPRKLLFLFPDYVTDFFSQEPRGGDLFFRSPIFLDYVLSNHLFSELYNTDESLQYVEDWFIESRPAFLSGGIARIRLPLSFLRKLEPVCRYRKKENHSFEDLYLQLAHAWRDEGQLDSAMHFYRQVDVSKLANICTANGNYGMHHAASAVETFAAGNDLSGAYRFVSAFKKPVNRCSLYGWAAQQLIIANTRNSMVDLLIDSARAEMNRVVNNGADQLGRFHVPYALALRSRDNDLTEIPAIVKNVTFKFAIEQRLSGALATNGDLYDATLRIPASVALPDKAAWLWQILYGYNRRGPNDKWTDYNSQQPWFNTILITYDNENS